MADKPKESTTKAKILSYVSPHVAIATIGGKQVWVNIPANSDHSPVGDCELKDKWKRREFSKEDQEAFDARKKEFSEKAGGEKVKGSEKDK